MKKVKMIYKLRLSPVYDLNSLQGVFSLSEGQHVKVHGQGAQDATVLPFLALTSSLKGSQAF